MHAEHGRLDQLRRLQQTRRGPLRSSTSRVIFPCYMLDNLDDTTSIDQTTQHSESLAQDTQHGSPDTAQDSAATQQSVSLALKPYRERTSIQSIPEEVLLHVFAQLPAQALAAVERVCKYWFVLAKSESSWRSAFLVNFDAENVPGRRVDPSSWRGEYILRTKLLQSVTCSCLAV